MRKFFLLVVMLVALIAVGGFLLYKYYLTDFIANAIVSESVPAYIPKRMQSKIEAISKPLNKGTEAMLANMHHSQISIDQVVKVVETTSERQAYSLLDELNESKPTTTDEVFDITKKHVSADFDVEVFRQPFNDHVTMKQVRQAMNYANLNRKTNDVDITTAKAIVKKILLQKEKEYQQSAQKN
jgi:hypothetical protein